MRRRASVVRRTPDFTVPVVAEVNFPTAPCRVPRWLKVAILFAGAVFLVLLGRLDYGSGQSLTPRKAPPAMASVEVAPPPPGPAQEQVATPQDVPTNVPVPTQEQAVSQPSVGILSATMAGGSGNGMPGPALDLGLAGGRGMGVATGGGGHGGGIGTGVGSGSGSGSGGTSARFVYNPGETDTDPRVLASSDPVYPRRAREDGVEPRVELRILVDERGRVEQVEVMGAPAGYGFEAALRSSVLQWRFQPATKGGVPVRTWVSQGYQFRLN